MIYPEMPCIGCPRLPGGSYVPDAMSLSTNHVVSHGFGVLPGSYAAVFRRRFTEQIVTEHWHHGVCLNWSREKQLFHWAEPLNSEMRDWWGDVGCYCYPCQDSRWDAGATCLQVSKEAVLWKHGLMTLPNTVALSISRTQVSLSLCASLLLKALQKNKDLPYAAVTIKWAGCKGQYVCVCHLHLYRYLLGAMVQPANFDSSYPVDHLVGNQELCMTLHAFRLRSPPSVSSAEHHISHRLRVQMLLLMSHQLRGGQVDSTCLQGLPTAPRQVHVSSQQRAVQGKYHTTVLPANLLTGVATQHDFGCR